MSLALQPRLLGDDPHHRLAIDSDQQLVDRAHPARPPGGEDDRGDWCAAGRPATGPHGGAGARLRARRDFAQKSADTHPVSTASSPGARPGAAAAPSRSRLTGERAQPGRPSTGTPPARPINSRLPGSTGMPKWSMAPPQADDRRRNHVAPVEDRRSAGDHPSPRRRRAPRRSSRAPPRRGAAPLGDEPAAELGEAFARGRAPSCRGWIP